VTGLLLACAVVVMATAGGTAATYVDRGPSPLSVRVAAGACLGIVGLLLTRWEATPATLHYTPNRWLVLVVTFVVSARVMYGLWRSWTVARAGFSGTPVMMAFGIPESLAAGGTVIGYYIAYGLGIRRRILKWQNRVLRVT